jgi:hypothetical protein
VAGFLALVVRLHNVERQECQECFALYFWLERWAAEEDDRIGWEVAVATMVLC